MWLNVFAISDWNARSASFGRCAPFSPRSLFRPASSKVHVLGARAGRLPRLACSLARFSPVGSRSVATLPSLSGGLFASVFPPSFFPACSCSPLVPLGCAIGRLPARARVVWCYLRKSIVLVIKVRFSCELRGELKNWSPPPAQIARSRRRLGSTPGGPARLGRQVVLVVIPFCWLFASQF